MRPVTLGPVVDLEPQSPEVGSNVIPELAQDPPPIGSEDLELSQAGALRITVTDFFETWEKGEISTILSFYVNSSETVVEWKGAVPFVWEGSYQGYDKVSQLTGIRSIITEMHTVLSNYTVTFDGNKAIVTARLYSTAEGKQAGKFFMELDIETEWENTEEGWKISKDTWDFVRVAAEQTIAHAWP